MTGVQTCALPIFMTTVNANIIPARDFNGKAADFIELAKKHLKPFQVKVNTDRLS